MLTSSTDTTVDYYHILGISPDATLEEIRTAYRDKLRLWHPDLVADKTEDVRQTANEMTAQLNMAYECLSDPDRRSAYDTSIRASTASATRRSTPHLVVSPSTLRCDVTPGDTVRLTLNIQADDPPGWDGLQLHTSDRLVAADVTMTRLSASNVRLTVRVNTSRLSAHRSYHIPIVVTCGKLTGTATLKVRTTKPREADFNPPTHRTSSTRSHSSHRPRDLVTTSLGGIVLPLLVVAWASGLLAAPTPANPPLVAATSASVIAATTWVLTSSRLLRQPDRLARIGVIWGHLMRWSGWVLVGSGAVLLGIPAVVLVLMAVLATPLLGFVVFAIISGRFDSQSR